MAPREERQPETSGGYRTFVAGMLSPGDEPPCSLLFVFGGKPTEELVGFHVAYRQALKEHAVQLAKMWTTALGLPPEALASVVATGSEESSGESSWSYEWSSGPSILTARIQVYPWNSQWEVRLDIGIFKRP